MLQLSTHDGRISINAGSHKYSGYKYVYSQTPTHAMYKAEPFIPPDRSANGTVIDKIRRVIA